MSKQVPLSVAKRRYAIDFTIAIVGYIVILLASLIAINHGLANPWRVVVALTPLVPIAFLFAAIVRFMNSIDELQRRIHVESLALAAGITALLAITYGFLEGVGLPRISMWFTYACVLLAWLISQPFVARRYR